MIKETTVNASTEPLGSRTVTISAEYFYELHRIAGQQIDPATAEVTWDYARTLDPYGVHRDLPEECQQVGREYFARAPKTKVWVCFGDLPDATREVLWKQHSRQLAFPAGLEGMFDKEAIEKQE